MDNIENILDELNDFEKHKTAEIPKPLEDYITHLAKTGDTVFPWPKIKGVIRHKLELVIHNFKEICPTENLPPCPNVEPFNYETMHDKIFEQFDSFTCAPFTIQRLCELMCSPRKHYKRTDKFMRGVEKNLLVVSTVDPGQRIRTESVSAQTLVNGVMESNTASSRAATVPQGDQRPSSAASDAVSISDADSGISDTEDEEKSVEKVSEAVIRESYEQPAETVEARNGDSQVTSTEPEPKHETIQSSSSTQNMAEADQSVTEPASDKMSQLEANEPKSVNTNESNAERSEETPSPQNTEETGKEPENPNHNVTADPEGDTNNLIDVAKTNVGSETPTSDKKRPLEDGEDEEDCPDAKLPRMYSPDKVVDENHSSESTSTESEPSANVEPLPNSSEQQLAEHNSSDENAAPAEPQFQ